MATRLTGTILVEQDYEGTLQEAIKEFNEEWGIDPETVNGQGFIGTCDGCGRIILEGQLYAESEDDELRCSVCVDKHQQELGGEDRQAVAVVGEAEDPEDQ